MTDFMQEHHFQRRSATWEELVPSLLRHKLAILLTFIGTVLGAYATLEFALNERYDSEAKLLVKLGRENTEAPPTVMNSALFTSGIRLEELRSEVQMLTSRNIFERVVDKIGLDAFKFDPAPPQTLLQKIKYQVKHAARFAKNQYKEVLYLTNVKKRLTDREAAILAVEGATSVDVAKDSDVIAVRVGLPSGPLSKQVAEELLDFYFDDHVQVRRTNEAKSFFDEQVATHLASLKELEQNRDEVRREWDLSSVPEQRRLALERRSDIEKQIAGNDAHMAMLRAQQQVLLARVAEMPDRLLSSQVVTPNPSVQSIKDRMTELQIEQAKLASRYQSDSLVIQNIEGQIRTIESLRNSEDPQQVGSETTNLNPIKQAFNQQIEEISANIAGLWMSNQTLRNSRAEIEHRLANLNRGEDALTNVERERLLAEQSYASYAKRREEVRIAEELDLRRVANVVVLSPPSVPFEPAYPPKLLILGAALAVGLLLGIGIALLLEYLRDTIEIPNDLDAVGGMVYLGSFSVKGHSSSQSSVAGKEVGSV